jgi:hypothetical protein
VVLFDFNSIEPLGDSMKRVAFLLLFIGGWLVPGGYAQDNEHVQVGVFADYFRVSQTDTDLLGVGGRASFVAYKRIKLEGEMAYDFGRAFTEDFTDTSTPGVIRTTFQRTDLRVIHGLFGPRVNLGTHTIQPFVTVKGGFVNFRLDKSPATFGTFTSSVSGLRDNNVMGTLYPGGGLEGHLGPIGLRFDIGDEMYFQHGTHHNLRATFGPVIRF